MTAMHQQFEGIPRAAIEEELQKILGSWSFRHAIQLQRFLRYIVEQAIAGRSQLLKEYSLGLAVFEKPASFDPRMDSIVRVYATRLRGRLEDYYANEGIQDRIRIDLAPGNYTPRFHRIKSSRQPQYYSTNPEAQDSYLRAKYLWGRRDSLETVRSAKEFFEKAIEKDPNYAPAYVGFSDACTYLAVHDYVRPLSLADNALAAAETALKLNPNLADAYASLAHAQAIFRWDLISAHKNFQAAFSLDDQWALTHTWYVTSCLLPQAALTEALDEVLIAQSLDPVGAGRICIASNLARVYYFAGEFDRARVEARRVINLDRQDFFAFRVLGAAEERLGNYKKAEAAFQAALRIRPDYVRLRAALGVTWALSGRRADSLRLARSLAGMAERRYVSPFDTASIYLALGDMKRGYDLLEEAREHHSYNVALLPIDPRFEHLRQDSRFSRFLNSVSPVKPARAST